MYTSNASKSKILPVTPMAGAKRDCLKFEKLVGIKDAERLGSAFPGGAWERAEKQPPIKQSLCHKFIRNGHDDV